MKGGRFLLASSINSHKENEQPDPSGLAVHFLQGYKNTLKLDFRSHLENARSPGVIDHSKGRFVRQVCRREVKLRRVEDIIDLAANLKLNFLSQAEGLEKSQVIRQSARTTQPSITDRFG